MMAMVKKNNAMSISNFDTIHVLESKMDSDGADYSAANIKYRMDVSSVSSSYITS